MKPMGRIVFRPAAAGVWATLASLLLIAGPAFAAGSPEAGEVKAAVCSACHGPGGNSLNPIWPSLAGQNALYLSRSIQAYKDGERSDPLMTAQAAALDSEDIADLAAYFSSRTASPSTAAAPTGNTGERLYLGGNKETGTPACAACHGPGGAGNAPAGYPALAGQKAMYVATQLRNYRSGQRTSDLNQMMRNATARLTDSEIDAVSAYVQALP